MTTTSDFVPTADVVGMLPMITYFFLIVTAYAFLGSLIFSLTTGASIAPEHRISRTYGAIIAAVAGVSYLLISRFYHGMLYDLSRATTAEGREALVRHSYYAIGQYRYLDWAVTTPLLLLEATSMLRIRFREAAGAITLLLLADFFMILTGYIGEQQFTTNGESMAGAKLLWGAVSTVGYLVVPYVLYGLYKRFAERGNATERWGFRFIALTTVTTWGVYPVGYLLALTHFDLNYIHISFSIADVFNKVGVTAVVFMVGNRLLDEQPTERVNEQPDGRVNERLNEKKVLAGYGVK